MLNNIIKHPNLGITTSFTNANLEKVNRVLPQAVDEFVPRFSNSQMTRFLLNDKKIYLPEDV